MLRFHCNIYRMIHLPFDSSGQWINYVMATLFLNDLKHVWLSVLHFLLLVRQQICKYQYICVKLIYQSTQFISWALLDISQNKIKHFINVNLSEKIPLGCKIQTCIGHSFFWPLWGSGNKL